LVPDGGGELAALPADRLAAELAPCANKTMVVARIATAAITAVALAFIIAASFLLLTTAQSACSRNKPDQ